MGIPRGVIGKYLVRGKKALYTLLITNQNQSASMGLLSKELGVAAHHALEVQHGECPREGLVLPYALDGTIVAVQKPQDPDDFNRYWSAAKKLSAVNHVLLVTNLGVIIAYRVCLPGTITDVRGAEPIFNMLFDKAANPDLHGVIVDYGLSAYCHAFPDEAPVVRPFQPTKDVFPVDPELRARVAEFSRWVCSCRQYNEWINGSAKRGFPRMLVRLDVRYIDRMIKDMELFFHLYNFRVRECNWSQARTVYFEHALALFADQGYSYDDATCTYDAVGLVQHPDEDDGAD
jgi:hypothetical protein